VFAIPIEVQEMSELEIHLFPCRSDNYGVLVHDGDANLTLAIDTPETDAVRNALKERGWGLNYILTTHHHFDHVEGNEPLKKETGCMVVGPEGEADKIPAIDLAIGEEDEFEFGTRKITVISTPGHTISPNTYWIKDSNLLFTGDMLFAMGCGRLFEGTARMMWGSLQKIMALPRQTQIYCGHEYTLSNDEFALSVEPDNEELKNRVEEVRVARRAGIPTVPTELGRELETNVFLRAASPEIRERLGMQKAEDWQVFGEIRRLKDQG